ncbi:GNAT family N-acetyltransferase [Shewanella sp. 3_MG-2023]|uniref:GNAT family N-acetyltransferase n=1 Tax=Shewanella sp. 3_MG-2023 TaxID=3062635 RepID=UPI0026E2851E|nr:GNAT family N-acetyltransferase [Shewanella sp. 3_MG-2023]MDO6775555.1 GNAT family N-acetyltransferase [Shewanella sp. 3_MG-2023]
MRKTQWLFDDVTQFKTSIAPAMTARQQKCWSMLKQFYKQQMPYSKPTMKEDIAVIMAQDTQLQQSNIDKEMNEPVNTVSSAAIAKGKSRNNPDNSIIAVVRIKPIGQYQLVTGLVVASEYRGGGLAHTLLAFIAEKLKCEQCFVFSLPHLTQLYQEHGFNEVKLATNDIQQLYLKHRSPQKPLVLMQLQTQLSSRK